MVSAHATVGRGDAGTGNADALGTVRHRLTVDGGERVLDVRSDLLRVRPFEFALRERIARLASFRHPAFVHVRRVERNPGSPASLSVVSDAARGVSLQAVIAFASARRSPVRREWAIDCVRQLVDATVALHAIGSDVAHGVLTADRIVIDPASKLSICDYVFGPALEHLRYPADQYWTDLRLPVQADGAAFDQALDIYQIGVVAIALLMPGASPADLRASLEHPRGDEQPLDRDLKYWVCRALHVDVPFASAADAAQALDAIVVEHDVKKGFNPELAEVLEGGAAVLESAAALEGGAAPRDEREAAPGAPAAAPATVEELLFEFETRANATAAFVNGLPPVPAAHSAASDTPLDSVDNAPAVADSDDAAARGRHYFAAIAAAWSEPRQPKRAIVAGCIAAVCMSVVAFTSVRWMRSGRTAPVATLQDAAAELGGSALASIAPDLKADADTVPTPNATIAPAATSPAASPVPPVAAPAVGTLQVRTQPSGATVILDGKNAGVSPIVASVAPGSHTIAVATPAGSITDTVSVQSGVTTAVIIPLAAKRAAAAPAGGGWMELRSRVDVQVLEDNRVIATSDTPRIMLPVGTHQLEIVNAAAGFRTRRSIEITAGQSTALTIIAPNGTLALNAIPWAEVSLDGDRIGQTPLGKVSASIGKHEVVFRHPTLGEQRRTVVVPATGVVRLSVNFTKPTE